MLYCEECEGNVPGGLGAFQRHLKDHKAPFICVNESCWNDRKLYSVKSSFIRHLEAHHARLCAASDEIIEEHSDEENGSSEFVLTDTRTEEDRRQNLYETSNESLDDVNQHETNDEMDASQNDEGGQDDEDPVQFHTKLEEAAALLVLNLWRHGNVPGVAISRVMTETTKLMNSVVLATQDIIISNLRKHGVPEPTIVNSVQNIYIHDPFIKLKSMDNQLDTFEELFALVKPERKPLGRRLEDRIDRHSRLYLPVDVAISFQYVSVIKTLTVILNNPVLFKLIHEERPSTDGNLRSYLDASACRDHPLIKEFPHTLRLVKWMDDSEVVNAQGAKTSIHKIVADCFIVQNLPYEENSRLRSIHLSSYAYREDLPEGNGTDALLDPFFAELEKLESPDGVTVTVNGQPFVLRATLIAFAADALAAHELLGLMSTSCNRICSQCLVHKQELYQNILATGKERTRDMHAANLQELHTKGAKIAAISSGVKRLSTLVEKSTHAVFPEAMIKDPMHDFLRGIVPMEIKLVLHHYVVVKKYFEIEDFNAQLKSFAYGPADMKNKPSPNFTLASLQKPLSYVMHQSASQAWCLLRVFPFIISVFPKVPENCPHLRLLVLLKRLLDVVLSTVISPQDLDLLDQLTEEHHLLFFSLYPPPPLHQQEVPAGQMQQQDANEDSDDDLNEDFLQEEEDDPDDSVPTPAHENPAKKQKKKEKVVRPLFKHHYSLHYRDFIERYGPSILYWCMRFEGKNALTKRYGAICNNFQNLPVTFTNLHQIIHAADLRDIKNSVRDEVDSPRGKLRVASKVTDFMALSELGVSEYDVLKEVQHVSVGGFKFIVGLFIALPMVLDNLPTFGKILRLYVLGDRVFVVTEDIKTVSYDLRFAAYLIDESATEKTVRVFIPSSLPPVRPFSAWMALNSSYLSPKNLFADFYMNASLDD